jgi:hypothetical protein
VHRTSIIRVRNSWIGGRAVAQCRAGNDRRDERGSAERRICPQQIAGRCISLGCSCLQVFSKCAALLDGGPTISNDDGGRGGAETVALVSAGLS